jgi:hypothetical protein
MFVFARDGSRELAGIGDATEMVLDVHPTTPTQLTCPMQIGVINKAMDVMIFFMGSLCQYTILLLAFTCQTFMEVTNMGVADPK